LGHHQIDKGSGKVKWKQLALVVVLAAVLIGGLSALAGYAFQGLGPVLNKSIVG
jgi:hypothetical protein